MKFLINILARLVKFPDLAALPVHLAFIVATIDLRIAKAFARDLPDPLDRHGVYSVLLHAELLLLVLRVAALVLEYLLLSVPAHLDLARLPAALAREVPARLRGRHHHAVGIRDGPGRLEGVTWRKIAALAMQVLDPNPCYAGVFREQSTLGK